MTLDMHRLQVEFVNKAWMSVVSRSRYSLSRKKKYYFDEVRFRTRIFMNVPLLLEMSLVRPILECGAGIRKGREK